MANKYVYCVWDKTHDKRYDDIEYVYKFGAEFACAEAEQFQVGASRKFGIRRRLRTPRWEEIP